MAKTCYIWLSLLLPQLVFSQSYYTYNTAAYGVCDSACQTLQRAGLVALYDATGVRYLDLFGAPHAAFCMTNSNTESSICAGFCMDIQ